MTLLGLAVLTACSSKPAPEERASRPDLTGWVSLPVENLTVDRVGEQHVIKVKTTTNTGGWTVDLIPWNHPSPPNVWISELAGKPPEGPSDDAVTTHEIKLPITLDRTTRWVQVNGQNGTFKYLVPWMPSG